MNQAQVTEYFTQTRALLAGDSILDSYIIGAARGLCREQPVPVVVHEDTVHRPGGAANAAANLRSLGADVRFVSVVGDDSAGDTLRQQLEAQGIALDWLDVIRGAHTSHKTRILAGTHYLARVDDPPSSMDAPLARERFEASLHRALRSFDVALLSDYGSGTISLASAKAIEEACAHDGRPFVIDAKDLSFYKDVCHATMTPNLDEASLAARVAPPKNERDVYELGERLRESICARCIVITMGGDGLLIVDEHRMRHIHARHVAANATVGAGDSFAATLALALTRCDVETSARLALEAAAVAVAKPFTATVTGAELRERLDLLTTADEPQDDSDAEAVFAKILERRAAGARIVLTNGVFDLLHEGHIAMLRQAREYGDMLVVAVNSDRSAREVKGPDRPITGLRQRLSVLGALTSVDALVTFDEPTAERIVERIRPDVYVHGDDRPRDELPEAARAYSLGAEVIFLPKTRPITTTRLIERITARSPAWTPQ